VKVLRLSDSHGPALEELLLREPITNLFLLGQIDAGALGRSNWYGAMDGEALLGATLIVPGRVAVPYATHDDVAVAIGRYLRWRHRPCMLVGPRAACDALWRAWAPDAQVDRWYDQRLYVCTAPVEGEPLAGFRRARAQDASVIAHYADLMEQEDLGRFPRKEDPEGFLRSVHRRIEQGATWVLELHGQLAFQIHVGTSTPWGVQVGGTYVPAAFRGQGLAAACMRELGRRLLPQHRCITLHVNEANTPAVRSYERSGYIRDVPYRLLTLPP
jgi:ribosomal protein S18 acetylase RimI-like enzyme